MSCTDYFTFRILLSIVSSIILYYLVKNAVWAKYLYFLSLENAYEADSLLRNHKWAGIALAGLTVLLYFFRKRKKFIKVYSQY